MLDLLFPLSYAVVLVKVREVISLFVDISVIVDQHCINFIFIMVIDI